MSATSTAPAPAPGDPTPALPGAFYTDERVYAAELAAVISRTWQAVGHETDLPDVGSRIVGHVGPYEVVVVRGEDRELRAFRNVCRHRGTKLVRGPETAEAIRCPYHGWTYRLDGSLLGAPEARQIPCLDKPSLGLLTARVETLLGFVFVNLDVDAPTLASQVPGLTERAARYVAGDLRPFGRARLHDWTDTSLVQQANWKISVDNYLEGYHVPAAHPGLMRLLDYQRYEATLHEGYVWVEAPMRAEPSKNRAERLYQRTVSTMPGLDAGDERTWRYCLIYPNTALEFYPDMVYAWTMVPDGVGRVVMPEASYRPSGTSLRTRFAGRVNGFVNRLVSDEDAMIVERQHIGLGTPGFRCGPLSRRELPVSWFADRIRRDLARAGVHDEGYAADLEAQRPRSAPAVAPSTSPSPPASSTDAEVTA
jgi:Rieske 2Fe-2S family protein